MSKYNLIRAEHSPYTKQFQSGRGSFPKKIIQSTRVFSMALIQNDAPGGQGAIRIK